MRLPPSALIFPRIRGSYRAEHTTPPRIRGPFSSFHLPLDSKIVALEGPRATALQCRGEPFFLRTRPESFANHPAPGSSRPTPGAQRLLRCRRFHNFPERNERRYVPQVSAGLVCRSSPRAFAQPGPKGLG